MPTPQVEIESGNPADKLAATKTFPVPTTIHVAIVEDDEGIRAGLASMLERSAGFRFVGGFGDAESALAQLPRSKAEVVLMDINLPKMDGVECVRQLKPKMSGVQFIMLTVYEDNERLFQSLMAGANGYLLKRTPPAKLLAAIREVHDGGSPMSPQIARRVVQQFRQAPATASSDIEQLTPREKEILDQLSKGFRYKEITGNLGVSIDTVRTHIRKIYEKLRVHSRTEAIIKYLGR